MPIYTVNKIPYKRPFYYGLPPQLSEGRITFLEIIEYNTAENIMRTAELINIIRLRGEKQLLIFHAIEDHAIR